MSVCHHGLILGSCSPPLCTSSPAYEFRGPVYIFRHTQKNTANTSTITKCRHPKWPVIRLHSTLPLCTHQVQKVHLPSPSEADGTEDGGRHSCVIARFSQRVHSHKVSSLGARMQKRTNQSMSQLVSPPYQAGRREGLLVPRCTKPTFCKFGEQWLVNVMFLALRCILATQHPLTDSLYVVFL